MKPSEIRPGAALPAARAAGARAEREEVPVETFRLQDPSLEEHLSLLGSFAQRLQGAGKHVEIEVEPGRLASASLQALKDAGVQVRESPPREAVRHTKMLIVDDRAFQAGPHGTLVDFGDRLHEDLDRVAARGGNALVIGPAASGKLTASQEWAQRSGQPSVTVSLSGATAPEDLVGSWRPNPRAGDPREPDLVFEPARFAHCVAAGGLVILDDLGGAAPEVQGFVARLLRDGEGGGLKVDPETRFLATAHPSSRLHPDLTAVFEEIRL